MHWGRNLNSGGKERDYAEYAQRLFDDSDNEFYEKSTKTNV